jgi:hypothetical protein
MPANGTAVALPVELEPSPAPAVTAPAPGAAPAQVVAEIQDGQAVASAVTVLCAAVLDRALTPATREAGGERIARVAELWLAHEGELRFGHPGIVRVFDRVGDDHAQRDRVLGPRHLLVQEGAAVHHPLRYTARTDFLPCSRFINRSISRLMISNSTMPPSAGCRCFLLM